MFSLLELPPWAELLELEEVDDAWLPAAELSELPLPPLSPEPSLPPRSLELPCSLELPWPPELPSLLPPPLLRLALSVALWLLLPAEALSELPSDVEEAAAAAGLLLA